ncbi:MAG: hypothetical protein WC901_05200 [Candidatus Margulisiibacteriota bacterium]
MSKLFAVSCELLAMSGLLLIVNCGLGWSVPVGDVVPKGQTVFEILYSHSQTQSTVTNGVPMRIGYGIADKVEIRGGTTISDTPGGQSSSYLLSAKWQVSTQTPENNNADVAFAVPVTYAANSDWYSFGLLVDASKDLGQWVPYLCFGMSETVYRDHSELTYPVYIGIDYRWTKKVEVYAHVGSSASNAGTEMPTLVEIGTEIKI